VEPALLERPIGLRSDIGHVHQAITSTSSAASPKTQDDYDQGLTLLHHYVWVDAARSFHEALRADPDCAMCWMGLARAEQGSERPDATRAAIANAQRLAPKTTPREQAFIALRALQIEAQDAAGPEQAQKFDAYKEAIDRALAAYPDDAELWILRGNAEEPGPWGRGQFGGSASIAFYETALVRSPGHLGAHHYLVHSYENIAHPAEAARHGRIYADAAPGVAHAQHMLGHVLPRLGRWEEALAQFRKADAIEEEYARQLRLRPGDDWHHLHNLQLLGYTELRLGRLAEAEATFRRAFDTPARLPYRGTPQASLAEFYLLRGRLDDALAVSRALQTPTRTPATHAVAAIVEGETPSRWARRTKPAPARRGRSRRWRRRTPRSPSSRRATSTSSCSPTSISSTPRSRCAATAPGAAEASILAVADALSTNPRFDAWGEGPLPAPADRRRRAAGRTDAARGRHRDADEEDRPGPSFQFSVRSSQFRN
jgi:tetratricopeptide (TPR) repeat protein